MVSVEALVAAQMAERWNWWLRCQCEKCGVLEVHTAGEKSYGLAGLRVCAISSVAWHR